MQNLLRYIPAKLVVILFSFLLIPIFTQILNVKEVSIYLLGVQLLNLFCTFSSDWIAKGVLRFYTKYKIEDRLDEFYSSIIFISALVYLIILILFFILKNLVYINLMISNSLFALVILLILPTGTRQILYQLVRIKNRAKLYTMSIIFYHIIFMAIFLFLVNYIQSAFSIILAMILAMICVDYYLIKSLELKKNGIIKPKTDIIINVLKYALPLVLTNILYWLLLNSSLLFFQNSKNYLYSASISISMTISNIVITSIAALFLFVAFPLFIKDFEKNKNIKKYYTNFIQLYLYILMPLVAIFCFFSKDIVFLFLPKEYLIVANILPFLAVMYFMHEFLKIINIKYHLKNKTYLEMMVNGVLILIALFILPNMIKHFGIYGAMWLLLITECLLFVINHCFKLKNIDYINYLSVFKTLVYVLGIILFSYLFINNIIFLVKPVFIIVKILFFITLTYSINYLFKNKILY